MSKPEREVEATGERASGRRMFIWAIVIFALVMGSFYGVLLAPFFVNHVQVPYLHASARAAVWVLNVFGENASASGAIVATPRFRMEVRAGCEGLEPTALFAAAVIALPVALRRRLLGLVVGVLLLVLLNLTRIVSLYYVGVHYRSSFETIHIDVWQPAFVVCAVVLWFGWALWATRRQPNPAP